MEEAVQIEKLRQLFSRDNFAERLGIELVDLSAGRDDLRQERD